MNEKSTKFLLIINAFLLLALLFILVSKEPVYVSSQTNSTTPSSGSSFESVELGDNLIAIIHSDYNTLRYGEIVVLEYDTDLNTFSEINDYDIFSAE
ncbi:hypothetical protein SAMN04488102_102203 [Alkalibacterium subtropicum]|uniref:Uncharacterized protein n=1 Tax=Alkalibacterium subtropicum TaxID=753702 RepID=A0A1I1FQ20_9LACT|nr:hypothetical protein [Alkalibacterium subtropicum]SFC01547.1 hypothetical protein SAMN04488102_102203 [Alkalibacterium subtropicum]